MTQDIFKKRTILKAPVKEVFKWHARPGALERLVPPWDPLYVMAKNGGIQKGGIAVLKMKAGPFPCIWIAEHTDYEENRFFKDRQIKGPFSSWVHTHRFEPSGDHECWLEDQIDFSLPFSPLGNMFTSVVQKKLERIFTYRHNTLSLDLEDHLTRTDTKPLRILISGASGLVGSALVPFLTTGGHQVIRLVRRTPDNMANEVRWDPDKNWIDTQSLGKIDVVINLSGENIGKGKWTKKKKRKIIESRNKSTALIAETISRLDPCPKVFVSASAIGFYGDRGGEFITEEDACGGSFISDVCNQWEQAAKAASKKNIRTVFLRIGMALSPLGGALEQLMPSFKAGLGGKLGHGNQYISWIGIDDLLGVIYHTINNENIHGPVNVVAPNPVTNMEFTATLARVLSRPAKFSLPESVIKLAFGEMGKEILLASTRVKPEKLIQSGYRFRHPDLEGVLRHLLGRGLEYV